MPKSKKPKIVSLVAYQSGDDDESDSGSSINSKDSDDQQSEQSDNEVSKKSSDFEIEDLNEKRSVDEECIISDDDGTKKLNSREGSVVLDELSNTRSPAVMSVRLETEIADVIDEVLEVEEDQALSEEQPATSTKLTLEKGFPPGCESIKLPSAPKAPCSQSLQNKIIQVVDRMNRFNYSINEDIRSKKSFKNPCIYEKLIEAYGIDEFGSSFPTHIEDLKANGYMFYDDLDAEQRLEWAKLEKAKKERTKIEMVSGTKKTGK